MKQSPRHSHIIVWCKRCQHVLRRGFGTQWLRAGQTAQSPPHPLSCLDTFLLRIRIVLCNNSKSQKLLSPSRRWPLQEGRKVCRSTPFSSPDLRKALLMAEMPLEKDNTWDSKSGACQIYQHMDKLECFAIDWDFYISNWNMCNWREKEMLNVSSMKVKCQSMKHITLAKLERHEHSTKSNGGMQLERYLIVSLKIWADAVFTENKQTKSKNIFKLIL